jgi:hypothetical protein
LYCSFCSTLNFCITLYCSFCSTLNFCITLYCSFCWFWISQSSLLLCSLVWVLSLLN